MLKKKIYFFFFFVKGADLVIAHYVQKVGGINGNTQINNWILSFVGKNYAGWAPGLNLEDIGQLIDKTH